MLESKQGACTQMLAAYQLDLRCKITQQKAKQSPQAEDVAVISSSFNGAEKSGKTPRPLAKSA